MIDTYHTNTFYDAKVAHIEPLRIITRMYSKCEEKVLPALQYVMYSDDLLPDQRRSLSKAMLVMEHFHIMILNFAELFGEGDLVSSTTFASYNIEKFLLGITKNMLKLFDKNNIEINIKCDKDCKRAIFDVRRMEIILYNLISNAVMHNPKKEKLIDIQVCLNDDDLIITISDNGKGISSNDAKSIFNISADALKDISFEYDYKTGTIRGLSIYVSKKLAADMNGSIKSRLSTKGAKIEITIPQNTRVTSAENIEFMEPDSYTLSDVYARKCCASALIHECFDNVPLDFEI